MNAPAAGGLTVLLHALIPPIRLTSPTVYRAAGAREGTRRAANTTWSWSPP